MRRRHLLQFGAKLFGVHRQREVRNGRVRKQRVHGVRGNVLPVHRRKNVR